MLRSSFDAPPYSLVSNVRLVILQQRTRSDIISDIFLLINNLKPFTLLGLLLCYVVPSDYWYGLVTVSE